MSKDLNYRHLYYFWVAAKEGGVRRGADRLGIAVQTVSGQLKLLERSLGQSLFAPQGRGLVLTEAGRLALGYADQIFQLGEQMCDALADTTAGGSQRLSVGISDAMPKLLAHRLLEPVTRMVQAPRLVCHEGEFDQLLGELALHKLDVVLTDRPVLPTARLRVFSHPLGEHQLAVFGSADLAVRYAQNFPACLHGAPMLLPTRHTAIRARLDQWFEARGLRPQVVAEFEDSALLATFGGKGLGLFPAVAALAVALQAQFAATAIGEMSELREQYFAISKERRIRHPAVELILAAPIVRPAASPAGPAG